MVLKVAVPTRRGPCYPRCTPTYGRGGSQSHRLASGLIPGEGPAPGNGLLNNLIAYWPGDEVAGNALDAHTNGLDLTDTNTVTSNPGQVYALARQYTAVTNEYHTRPGDDALLSTGDIDFTLATWCYLDSNAFALVMVSKYNTAPQSEYILFYPQVPDRFRFQVSSDGTANALVDSNTFGAPPITTWHLVVCWHDSVANTINIQVNNGIADSQGHATGVHDSTARFQIGDFQSAAVPFDGRIGPTMFWKSAAGAGGVLTAAQRTALYNGGAGLTYAELTA